MARRAIFWGGDVHPTSYIVLPKLLKIFRLPTNNEANKIKISRKIILSPKGDNPIFIRITQEDGTQAWTSPIYVYR